MFGHTKSLGLLLLPCIVATAGCTFGEGDPTESYFVPATPTPDTSTPTATATPTAGATPTVDPYAGYRMSALVLEEEDGVDLDGNGRVDNDYAETLDAVSKSISSGFEDTCVTALEGVELPEGTPPVNILCKSVATAVTAALSGLVNVADYNNNVVEAMQTVQYLEKTAVPAPGNLAMSYYWGTDDGGELYLGDLISTHTGAVDDTGKAKLGPGAFSVALLLGNGGGNLVYMNLIKSRTELVYLDGDIGSPKLGGVLTEEALIEVIMQSVSSTVPLPEPILNQLSTVLEGLIPDCGTEDTSMEDCNTSLGGITMGFTYQLEAAVVY